MNFYPIFWKDMLLITKKPGKFLAASMVTPLLYLVTFGWGLGRGWRGRLRRVRESLRPR